MAHFQGKGGTVILGADGAVICAVDFWELDTKDEVEEKEIPLPSWKDMTLEFTVQLKPFWLVPVTVTVALPLVGSYDMEGYANAELTRAYFESPAYEDKFFLEHLNLERSTMRFERVCYDEDEARAWVLDD